MNVNIETALEIQEGKTYCLEVNEKWDVEEVQRAFKIFADRGIDVIIVSGAHLSRANEESHD
ncbi:MAG: hypothetical protein NVS3B1_06400 [Marmoricola sp.]